MKANTVTKKSVVKSSSTRSVKPKASKYEKHEIDAEAPDKAPETNMSIAISRALKPVDATVTGLDELPAMVASSVNENDLALQGIASRYVLGHTAKGRLTGRVESIGEFTLRKTKDTQHPNGRAFNANHQKATMKSHPELGKLEIVSDDERKALSAELDAVRKAYYAELKPVAIALHMDKRTEFQSMRLVKGKHGVSLTTRALIRAPEHSVENQLKAENASLKARLEALESMVPKKVMAQAVKQAEAQAIDVTSTTSDGNSAPVNPETPAEVQAAQPIVAA